MAQVDGGYSSGYWGEAAWGCSVYYPLISNAGWGLGAWGSDGWELVQVVPAPGGGDQLVAYMKRPLP